MYIFSGLQLNGVDFVNNSDLVLTDIGEGDSALYCVTDSTQCCRGSDNPSGGGLGEWYFPDGTLVQAASEPGNLYRNRALSIVRLNRRNTAPSPTGVYRCEVPSASEETLIILAGLYLGMIVCFVF